MLSRGQDVSNRCQLEMPSDNKGVLGLWNKVLTLFQVPAPPVVPWVFLRAGLIPSCWPELGCSGRDPSCGHI